MIRNIASRNDSDDQLISILLIIIILIVVIIVVAVIVIIDVIAVAITIAIVIAIDYFVVIVDDNRVGKQGLVGAVQYSIDLVKRSIIIIIIIP